MSTTAPARLQKPSSVDQNGLLIAMLEKLGTSLDEVLRKGRR